MGEVGKEVCMAGISSSSHMAYKLTNRKEGGERRGSEAGKRAEMVSSSTRPI